MVSEWPDKRDKTGFGSLARGEEIFFRVVILPKQDLVTIQIYSGGII